jgi:protein SDA1
MGLKSGERKILRYGEEEAGEIEGLELLEKWKEEERLKKKAEKGATSDGNDEAEASDDDDGWEVEEDVSDDSGGWIDVQSDAEIEVSDSEDNKPASKKVKLDSSVLSKEDDKENSAIPPDELQNKALAFATTRILTPADLIKLQELRLEASVNKALPIARRKKLAQQYEAQKNRHADDPLTATEIEGLAALKKSSKAEKVALAREGKTDRSEHKSTQARRTEKKNAEGKSTTNREKARKKNFMMTLSKGKKKQKQSLVQRGNTLKAHIKRSKRGGKRGNKGQ